MSQTPPVRKLPPQKRWATKLVEPSDRFPHGQSTVTFWPILLSGQSMKILREEFAGISVVSLGQPSAKAQTNFKHYPCMHWMRCSPNLLNAVVVLMVTVWLPVMLTVSLAVASRSSTNVFSRPVFTLADVNVMMIALEFLEQYMWSDTVWLRYTHLHWFDCRKKSCTFKLNTYH